MLHNILYMSGTVLVPVHVEHIIALLLNSLIRMLMPIHYLYVFNMSHSDNLISKTFPKHLSFLQLFCTLHSFVFYITVIL